MKKLEDLQKLYEDFGSECCHQLIDTIYYLANDDFERTATILRMGSYMLYDLGFRPYSMDRALGEALCEYGCYADEFANAASIIKSYVDFEGLGYDYYKSSLGEFYTNELDNTCFVEIFK